MCAKKEEHPSAFGQQQAQVNKLYAFGNNKNKFFNKETDWKRRTQFIQGIGRSRQLSDIAEATNKLRARGLAGKEKAAKSYAMSQPVPTGGQSTMAGRNAYKALLDQQHSIDKGILQMAGRGESVLQEKLRRIETSMIQKEGANLGVVPVFGAPVLKPPKKRGNIFMGLLSIGMSAAGAGLIPGVGAAAGSDKKLKKNIERVDTSKDGYPIYEFSYIGSRKRYRGVMAQDVVKTNPMAVHIKNGLLYVDYSKLDVDMELVS